MEIIVAILSAAVRSGTPILYATLGEILTERSGVLNLGLEGIMLMGAFTGFSFTYATGNPWIGILAAFITGMAVTLIHAFLSITMGANQVVSGLAITMAGTGASSLLGRHYIGQTITGLSPVPVPFLHNIPVLGPVLFDHDPLVYISFFLVAGMTFFLGFTKAGLNLRAVGDSPRSADSVGINVQKIRYLYTIIGGGIVAIGGAYMSVAYTKMWGDLMTAGRGWIAVALVIFAIWHPMRAAFGSYLFGGVTAFQLRLQTAGTNIPTSLLMILPYALTILVLFFISVRQGKGILFGAPASLGQPFYREERD